jgi:hypothetical protein
LVEYVKVQFNKYEILKSLLPIVNLVPTLIISIFNVLLPTVTKLLVEFEKWDFPETIIKNEIWRNYFQKFINLTVFVVISMNGLLDTSYIDSVLGTSFKNKIGLSSTSTNNCAYDSTAIALASLALTETVVLVFSQFIKAIGMKIFFGILLKKEWRKSRDKYLSDFVIWMLYNKAIHWLVIRNMPYFVLVTPFLDFVGFMYITFVLQTFYSKGHSASSDIS